MARPKDGPGRGGFDRSYSTPTETTTMHKHPFPTESKMTVKSGGNMVGDNPAGARGGSADTNAKATGSGTTLTNLPGRLAAPTGDQGVSMIASTMNDSGAERLTAAMKRYGAPDTGKA
jgi:hypothetical protein